MKNIKKIILYILLLSAISCKNTTIEKNISLHDDTIAVQEKIDINLLKELEYFKKMTESYYSKESINIDSNMCYTMKFSKEKKDLEVAIPHDSDPVVVISYNICGWSYDTGYKGALKIDNNYIAIFDSDDIGLYFYDKTALLNIGINELECLKTKFIYRIRIKIRGDSIVPYKWPNEYGFP